MRLRRLRSDALRIVLEKDPLVDATQLSADTRNFVIMLRGLVATSAEAQAAENDAWALFGVDRVVNDLEVRPEAGARRLRER